jgi:hypothetical protein
MRLYPKDGGLQWMKGLKPGVYLYQIQTHELKLVATMPDMLAQPVYQAGFIVN